MCPISYIEDRLDDMCTSRAEFLKGRELSYRWYQANGADGGRTSRFKEHLGTLNDSDVCCSRWLCVIASYATRLDVLKNLYSDTSTFREGSI
jgi:hypothetical protein